MACKQLACEGVGECLKVAEQEKKGSSQVFVLFTGKEDPSTGNSWCPDCVKAEPVIERSLKKVKTDDVFVICVVGDRSTWKDPRCEFRTHPSFKLKGIPTLMKWGTSVRLGPDECAKEELVTMLFVD